MNGSVKTREIEQIRLGDLGEEDPQPHSLLFLGAWVGEPGVAEGNLELNRVDSG